MLHLGAFVRYQTSVNYLDIDFKKSWNQDCTLSDLNSGLLWRNLRQLTVCQLDSLFSTDYSPQGHGILRPKQQEYSGYSTYIRTCVSSYQIGGHLHTLSFVKITQFPLKLRFENHMLFTRKTLVYLWYILNSQNFYILIFVEFGCLNSRPSSVTSTNMVQNFCSKSSFQSNIYRMSFCEKFCT